MKLTVKAVGAHELIDRINTLRQKSISDWRDTSVTVGFTQNYAIHVHEDLMARHKVGSAKYLEKPAREMQNNKELSRIVLHTYKQTKSIRTALLRAGLQMQRRAQLMTPVDTSALKASAFTCDTKDVEIVSRISYDNSQRIRTSADLSRKNKKRIAQAKAKRARTKAKRASGSARRKGGKR